MAALEVEKFIAEELGEGGTRVDMYVDLLFFISPELTPILHFSPHVYCTYCTMLCLIHLPTFTCVHTPSISSYTHSSVECSYQLALVLEIESLSETTLHTQRKERLSLVREAVKCSSLRTGNVI